MISRILSTQSLPWSYLKPSFRVVVLLLIFMHCIPSFASNVKEISAPELKRLIDSAQDLLVINVLSEIEYSIQHIPESINIPINTIEVTDKLPENKNVTLVFYCLSER